MVVENDITCLSMDQLSRVLRSLVADELAETRPSAGLVRQSLEWPLDGDFRKSGPELDSLELQNCTARVAEYFRLFEVGVEDLLMARASLVGWVETVMMAAPHLSGQITVQTSGTTGRPKKCTHDFERLSKDALAIADIVRPKRVLTNAPPHHVYGFIYTAIMPALRQLPVIELRDLAPSKACAEMSAGDLLVTTPFLLKNMLRQIPAFPKGVSILSSSAPLPDDIAEAALAQGAMQVIDVYGASETLGIGWRRAPDQTYTLFPHWQLTANQTAVSDQDGHVFSLMDTVESLGDQRFRLGGRRDNAVQIGGINVFPDAVRDTLLTVEGVQDAYVEVCRSSNGVDHYLTATLTCEADACQEAAEAAALQCVTETHGAKAAPRFTGATSEAQRLSA
ncbi:MAG: AMP-binding protein [Parvularculaceae bacterium]|nr:AMP-binding protein [Parvularculaceae bacterium]